MRRLVRRLMYLLRRSRLEADLREEIETHRALRQAQLERDGVVPADADRASRRMIGQIAISQNDVRDLWIGSVDAWWQDLRYGVWALVSRAGFTVTALLTLVLCIGANLVVFTIVNALWLRPRPMPDPDRVVMVLGGNDGLGTSEGFYFGRIGLAQFVESQPAFEAVAGQVPTSGEMSDNLPHITVPGVNREIETLAVTSQYFSVMRLRILGRDFTTEDDRPGGPPVVIISDRLWRQTFGASPSIIGAMVDASPMALRVIGIAPPGFHGARLGEQVDLWVSRYLVSHVARPGMGQRDPSLLALARLAPGVSPTDAERAVAQARADRTGSPYFVSFKVVPVGRLYGSPVGRTILVEQQTLMWIAGTTAALVLVAGCATLMAVVLVHYERRRQELAIRMALGCSRGRLVRTLGVELGGLVVAGAIGAIGAAWMGLRALPSLSLPGGLDLGRLDLNPDWRVAGFGVLAALGTLAAASVVPLSRSTRATLVADLVSSTARVTFSSQKLRSVILAAHVTAAIVVLVAGGLFVRTIIYGFTAGPGFDGNRTLFVDLKIRPASSGGLTDAQLTSRDVRNAALLDQLLFELQSLPGIEAAALGGSPIGLDQAASAARRRKLVVDSELRELHMSFFRVAPVFLNVLGVPSVAGRTLTDSDVRDPGAPGEHPVVVTRSFGEALWPGAVAVGRRFEFPDQEPARKSVFHIVGVVEDLPFGSLRLNQRAGVFEPTSVGRAVRPMNIGITLRAKGDAAALTESVRRAITAKFPHAPRIDVATGRDVIARDLGRERLGAWFFSGFGLVALILGVGGVFGLVAYAATSRRREMGVRLAIGAMPGQVARSIVCSGLWPVAVGTAVGLVTAGVLSRSVEALLIGVGRFDPMTYLSAAALMLSGAGAAGLVAAWRIRRLSPTDVLRAE